MAFMAPLAIAGMAVSAAGAAANAVAQRKQQQMVEKIQKRTRAGIQQNQAAATDVWQKQLAQMTPEEQQKLIAQKAAERLGGMQEAVAGGGDPGDVSQTSQDAPAIVKTEAARQLGDKLAVAKQQMAAAANLQGWGDTQFGKGIDLSRSGEKIAQYGDFASHIGQAGAQDIATAQAAGPKFPLGDLLMAGGSMMGSAGGGFGGGIPGGGAKMPTNWYRAL